MSSRLPDFVDPWHFADVGKEVSGRVKLLEMPRLAKLLADSDGEAEFIFSFQRGEKKRVHITGTVRAQLVLECQRCMYAVNYQVNNEINLVVVEGSLEAEQLPDKYDPLLAEDNRIRLQDVVEEELLLAMPQVPMHAESECTKADQNMVQPHKAAGEGETSEPNPFAVLAELKRKQT